MQAAKSLGKINPGNKTAINVLVQGLQSTQVDNLARWPLSKLFKTVRVIAKSITSL
jgi:hypothetical protein